MGKKIIAVIFGGNSTEYEVSLQSASSVFENINKDKFEIVPIGITRNGDWYHYTGKIEKIANKVGIAFQIEDDILDIVSTSETLGKPAGSDEKNGKNTYVLFRGLEQSGEDAKQYTEEALQLFDALEYKNDFLRELLLYLVGRKN